MNRAYLRLVILIITFRLGTSFIFKPRNQANAIIGNKLKTNFLTSNTNTFNLLKFNETLYQFQKSLIKLRNSECLLKNHKNFESTGYLTKSDDELWLETRKLWSNFSSNIDNSILSDEIVKKFNSLCISSTEIVNIFANESNNDYEYLFQLVLTQFTNTGCDLCNERPLVSPAVTRLETWGYGVLFVTIISLSSLCGAFVIPLSNSKIYKKILMFLIGIAVGSLAGSGFLHLIPQAYGITDDPNYSLHHIYVWKGLMMMFGVYLFYLVEKIMKIMIYKRKLSKCSKSSPKETENPKILESIGYVKTHEPDVEPNVEMRIRLDEKTIANNKQNSHSGHSHGFGDFQSVAPVAWMIIFGDGLHNFIDGLSIGAAFTESVLKGISICLAVICEEFPHELGDFAILINSGMSYPVALCFNFLSACCCYIGLAVGITIGENLGINEWIYAIAGGMFLYISLCNMIPELHEIGEEIERDYMLAKQQQTNQNNMPEEEKTLNGSGSTNEQMPLIDIKIKIKVLIIQNIGIIMGFLFMLLMAIYSENIKL